MTNSIALHQRFSNIRMAPTDFTREMLELFQMALKKYDYECRQKL